MAWVKIPAEHHALLIAALPKDPRVRTINMFGGTAALVNGNMFGGTFARSVIVKLGPDDYPEALALDGAEPFDPMGRGHVMSNTVLLPETVMDETAELKSWLARAFTYTATLPPKKKGAAKKPAAKKVPAKKLGAKKISARKPAAKRKKRS
ncbi:MAG TPA: TfoX/Sxy family protein [Kofleriaceae bacterium]|nr:TfoX/Sxy family protein [Kofleriaceae bacterium]